MMNKSLRARRLESSRKRIYGFQRVGRSERRRLKKEPPFPAAFEVDNREASNRVDRSHSVSKRGHSIHSWESLTGRKRTVLFNLRLPCRPLADHQARAPDAAQRAALRRDALLIRGPSRSPRGSRICGAARSRTML